MKALQILKLYQEDIYMNTPSSIDLDEAIKELEELQNRSCLLCIKYHKGTYPDDSYCDDGISQVEEFSLLEDDFCCNKFEAKGE